MSLIVIALGGNALQREGEASAKSQQEISDTTAEMLMPLIDAGHKLVVVHGNGPQVGNIMLHEEAINTDKVPSMPLDTCVAMSQGQIGYWLQSSFQKALRKYGINKSAATVVTQVVVGADDPAFQNPSKPVGPFYATEAEANQIATERGFVVKEDAGRGWRRVVPSPRPLEVVELGVINNLIANDTVVITAGGGGVPVIEKDNQHIGVEAVIDKDFSAAVVAKLVGADRLVILTAIDEVTINFRTPDETALHDISADEIEKYANDGQFAPGSMLPKVQAAVQFVRESGKPASIGSLEKVAEVLEGKSGTTISL